MNGQGGYVYVAGSSDVSDVAKFELIFKEILEITNFVNHVIENKYIEYLETSIQHSLNGSKGVKFR